MQIDQRFIDWLNGPDFRLSYSTLKSVLSSPANFYCTIMEKLTRTEQEPTPAQRFGTLIHTLVLEPETFEGKYVVGKKFGRTKAEQEEKALFAEQNAGKIVLTDEEFEKAQMILSSGSDELNRMREQLSYAELVIQKDIEDLRFKTIIDGLSLDHGTIFEVKTTSDVDADKLLSSFYNYKYTMQAALYKRMVREFHGVDPVFEYVVVQTVAPYKVYMLPAADRYIAYGEKQLADAISEFKMVRAMGNWGDGWNLKALDLPSWAVKQQERKDLEF